MELLRLTTAGSVDDGKSTLIGRLLMDSHELREDQIASVKRACKSADQAGMELALYTDGLKAEREQGITIDVAYRYFSTPRRKFILADTPGHVEYTRNMVTGASNSHLAVILVDAQRGITEQTYRHAFIASLLGIQSFVLAVNKMDLVDWSEARFFALRDEFLAFAERLDVSTIHAFPISALHGDNVVERSANMPWYDGPTLLYHIETTHVSADLNLRDARFPVQTVLRVSQQASTPDFRGYAGRLASGTLRVDDEVVVLPAGFTTRIRGIRTMDGELSEAFAPQSVVLTLADELDVGRGDMIVRPGNRPTVAQELDVMLCWLSRAHASQPRQRYLLRHTTREVQAMIGDVHYKVDVSTLHRTKDDLQLRMNDIARVSLRTAGPVFFDAYQRNRVTGSVILIDPRSNETVAAGMIR